MSQRFIALLRIATCAIVATCWLSGATALSMAAEPNPPGGSAKTVAAQASDWPQFLGPRRDGSSPETGLKLDWRDKPPAQLWKVEIGGGYSSPIIVGNRIYTMVNRGQRDWAICLDATSGKELWAYDAAPVYLDQQRQGPGPRATPTYDDGVVYCLFPAGEMVALTADNGKPKWKINIVQASGAKDYTQETFFWGLSGSPLVEGNNVIVQPGGNHDNSLVAFDKHSGKKAWGVGNDPPGYGSAIVIEAAGKRQIVACSGQSYFGVSPDGQPLWRFVWGNKYDCNCATPIWTERGLFVSSAYGAGDSLLDVQAKSGQWQVDSVWANKDLQNQFATSMIVDGHVYGCHGDLRTVTFRCVELATGKVKWAERGPGKCNLISNAGHLICLNERGTLSVIKADPAGYQPRGEMTGLLNYKCWTPPALAAGKLYARDEKHLICLDLRGP